MCTPTHGSVLYKTSTKYTDYKVQVFCERTANAACGGLRGLGVG